MFNKIFLNSILLTFLSICVSAQVEFWPSLSDNEFSLFSEKLSSRAQYEWLSTYNKGFENSSETKTRVDSSFKYYPHPDDSDILHLKYKDYYHYDSDRLKILAARYEQNIESGLFELYYSYLICTYNASGKILRKLWLNSAGLDFNFIENDPLTEIIYEYDNEQKLLFERFFNVNNQGEKIPTRHRKYIYDSSGRLDTFQFVSTDSTGSESITMQTVYHHDSMQRLLWDVLSVIGTEGLIKTDSTYYFCNGQNLLDREEVHLLQDQPNFLYKDYYYDQQDRLERYVDGSTYTDDNDFIHLFYDSRNAIEQIQYVDDSGLLLKEIVYTYIDDVTTEDLYVLGGIVTPKVNAIPTLPGQESYHPFIISNVTERSFDDIDFDFTDHYSLDYFYSSVETTAVTAPSSVSPILFSPNPAHRSIRMCSSEQRGQAQVWIFSGSGNLVHSQLIQAGDEISVENWAAGVYFYMVDWGDVQQTGKVVKVE